MYRQPIWLLSAVAATAAALNAAVPAPADGGPPGVETAHLPEFERPARMPESVPLSRAEPVAVLAGKRQPIRFRFTLGATIRPDDDLKLDLWGGRNNKGVFTGVQTDDPAAPGYLALKLDDGTPLALQNKLGRRSGTVAIKVPLAGLPAGQTVVATIGDPAKPDSGATAPATRMLNKFVVLYCPQRAAAAKNGQKWGLAMQQSMVAASIMHILGNPVDHLRAYVPSQCKPGQQIEVLVRPEDQYSNLSCQGLTDVQVFLGDQALPVTARPVKDSTCMAVQVRIPNAGTHRLKIVDTASGMSCLTNPTRCASESPRYNRYWGVLHGHSELSDGWGTIDNYFRQMRDEAALDFSASSDHDHVWETPDAYWQKICATVKRWNDPGRFVVFLGYEWAKWRRNGDGDRNVYYLNDDQPLFRSGETDYPRPPDLHKALDRRPALVIPHHPGGDGNHCDYKDHDPYHERLIEIHQVRGCYECSAEDGNPLIARPDRQGGKLVADGFVQRALALGWRAGFTAGGDDHLGTAGTDRPFRTTPDGRVIYAGSMAVLAKERTRDAIWNGLWQRRVVATSGPRMLLDVTLNGHPIGSELDASESPELAECRTIRVAFHGTAPVARIDVIRNNRVVHTTEQDTFTWKDTTPLADALLPPAKHCAHPFCFYYIRAVQTDHQTAWASPIWIDP